MCWQFTGCAERIRKMVDLGGWSEADAFIVLIGFASVGLGIGLAVRERRTVAVAICHGVHAPIARVGERMAAPVPDLFMPARGLPELGLQFGLFDNEPLAMVFERRGIGKGGGDAVTLFPLLMFLDDPNLFNNAAPFSATVMERTTS